MTISCRQQLDWYIILVLVTFSNELVGDANKKTDELKVIIENNSE